MVTSTTTRLSGVAGALAIKAPVRAATTANIALSGLQAIDAVTLVSDDRVLVKDQTVATENGIYNASSGVWARAKDFNGNRDVVTGTRVLVVEGATQAVSEWYVASASPITIDASPITWAATSPLTVLSTFGPGSESEPGLAPSTDLDSGLYRIGENNLGVAVGGAKVLDISAAGQGVTGTLDVSGAAALASTLTVAGAATLNGVVTHASTSHAVIAGGTTGQRPGTPAQKHIRFNTTTGFFEYYNGSAWVEVGKRQGPRGFIDGLILSNGASNVINIAAGSARDSTDTVDIDLAAFAKNFAATWVAGTGNGGLSSSLTALANNSWYHVFAIVAGGAADVAADTSLSAANLVADHAATAFRRIGSFRTDGSANIIAFVQVGDRFLWVDPPLDVNVTTPTADTAVLSTLSVPPGVRVHVTGNAFFQKNGKVYISPPDVNDETPSRTAAPLSTMDTSGTGVEHGSQFTSLTNTSSQIRWRPETNDTFRIATLWWDDPRGRNEP